MTELFKVKQTKHKDKSRNLIKHKKTHSKPNRLCELFLLTVPTEEVARWKYIKQF